MSCSCEKQGPSPKTCSSIRNSGSIRERAVITLLKSYTVINEPVKSILRGFIELSREDVGDRGLPGETKGNTEVLHLIL